jgi:type III secretory pathway component EscV
MFNLLDHSKIFNKEIKIIKIKNLDEKFYNEFDYIKDIDDMVKKQIHKKRFYQKLCDKKYEIYKTGLNNCKRIEIMNTIKDSKMYKLIDHINLQKKADFFDIDIIIQEQSFLLYAIENEYIEKRKIENIREYLIDIDFNKNYPEYDILIKQQNKYKNKIDDILELTSKNE